MNIAYILLGTNLGDKTSNINKAVKHLESAVGKVLQVSSIYETAPWGNTNQDSFLNAVVKISTTLSAVDLLRHILDIEAAMGRIHTEVKWGPRIIDIDILFYNNDIINDKNLIVPHPFLHARRFTLEPLNELASDYIHPVIKKSVKELLDVCEDNSEVKKSTNTTIN